MTTDADCLPNSKQLRVDVETFRACKNTDTAPEVISNLAKSWWNNPSALIRALGQAGELAISAAGVRTVGVYYFRMGTGGAEQLTARTIQLWVSMGLRVVLFTDEPEQPGDFPIDPSVQRVVLPEHLRTDQNNLIQRAQALHDVLIEYNIDALVYGQAVSEILPWDLLVCKAQNVPFVVYTFGSVRSLLCEAMPSHYQLAIVYRYLDGIATLSETDEHFWRMFNPNVLKILSPLTIEPNKETRSNLSSQTIIWLGRLSPYDKQPAEALKIMSLVKERVPEAKLMMVGPAVDEVVMQDLVRQAEELGISDRVTFTGNQKDPEPFLEKASIYLLTSRFEGYCIALAEAKAKGLPTVAYELPYLTLMRGDCGVQMVPPYDHEAAAAAVIKLLEDSQWRKEQSDIAFNQMDGLANSNLAELWSNMFASCTEGSDSREQFIEDDLMWDTVIDACLTSFDVLKRQTDDVAGQRDAVSAQLNQANKRCAEIEESTSFKVGKALMAVPCKVKDAFHAQ